MPRRSKKTEDPTHYGFVISVEPSNCNNMPFVGILTDRDGQVIRTDKCRWEGEARALAEDEAIRHQLVEAREPQANASGGYLPVVFDFAVEQASTMTQVAYAFPVLPTEAEAHDVASKYIEARRVKHGEEYELRRQSRAEYAGKIHVIEIERRRLEEARDEIKAKLKLLDARAKKIYEDFKHPTAQLELTLSKRAPLRSVGS